jgi:hypothetical protein
VNTMIEKFALEAGGSHYPRVNTMQLEKFYELVVDECARAVRDMVDHRIPASEYPDRIRKHFGADYERLNQSTCPTGWTNPDEK